VCVKFFNYFITKKMSFVQLVVSEGFEAVKTSCDIFVTITGHKDGDQIIKVPYGTVLDKVVADHLIQVDGNSYKLTWDKAAFADYRNKMAEPNAVAAVLHYCTEQSDLNKAVANAWLMTLALVHRFNWFTFQNAGLQLKDAPALLMALGTALSMPTDKTYQAVVTNLAASRSARDDPFAYMQTVLPYMQKAVTGQGSVTDFVFVKEIKNTLNGLLKDQPLENSFAWVAIPSAKQELLIEIRKLVSQLYDETGALYKALGTAKVSFSLMKGSYQVCAVYAGIILQDGEEEYVD
jgi:hypothetical protein